MIYVVLGMHKSGTTLVSQMLHESGIHMGDFDSDLGYDQDNKFERHTAQEINRDLLDGYLIPPLGSVLRRFARPEFDRAGYRRNSDSQALIRYTALKRRFAGPIEGTFSERMQALIADANRQHTDWGFKDPRTCLTYPAWEQSLGEHRLIVVYRHYAELMRRYNVENPSLRKLPRALRVLHSWAVHNQAILEHLARAQAPRIVLRYENLMSDDTEIERFEDFVGQRLVDVRDPQLYRNRARSSQQTFQIPGPIRTFLPYSPNNIIKSLDDLRG